MRAEIVDEETERTLTVDALVRATLALFEKCVKLSNTLPEEAYITAMNIDQPGWLADFIVSAIEPPDCRSSKYPGGFQYRGTITKDLYPGYEGIEYSGIRESNS